MLNKQVTTSNYDYSGIIHSDVVEKRLSNEKHTAQIVGINFD